MTTSGALTNAELLRELRTGLRELLQRLDNYIELGATDDQEVNDELDLGLALAAKTDRLLHEAGLKAHGARRQLEELSLRSSAPRDA